MSAPSEAEAAGRAAYEAFYDDVRTGAVPPWDELRPEWRPCWIAAAKAGHDVYAAEAAAAVRDAAPPATPCEFCKGEGSYAVSYGSAGTDWEPCDACGGTGDAAPPDPTLGEALSRARLASVALALAEFNGTDAAIAEATSILAALCNYLVEHGAVDPMEDDA